jgi:hypothetical protein
MDGMRILDNTNPSTVLSCRCCCLEEKKACESERENYKKSGKKDKRREKEKKKGEMEKGTLFVPLLLFS